MLVCVHSSINPFELIEAGQFERALRTPRLEKWFSRILRRLAVAVQPEPLPDTMNSSGGEPLNETGLSGVYLNGRIGPDDAELVHTFGDGSEQAFKELVRHYEAPLYRFVWRQVRNHTEAADLCQEIFVKVFLKARSFRGESSFRTWLYQIAINQCKNHFRSRGRERLEDVEIETLPLADGPSSDAAEAAQEARRLRAAVEALPPRQRDTLELRFYQDCTFAEIAEIMSCPVGTAKANYHHAITSLRKRMRGQEP